MLSVVRGQSLWQRFLTSMRWQMLVDARRGGRRRQRSVTAACVQPLESRVMLTVELASQAAFEIDGLDGSIETVEDISDDGRFVLFTTFQQDLVPGQNDTGGRDLFRLDRDTGTILLVSHSGDGLSTTGRGITTGQSKISGDGSTIVFVSDAKNQVPGQISPTFADDVFSWSASTGLVTLISHTGDGVTTGNAFSYWPEISDDGGVIAFVTRATDLIAGVNDSNGSADDVYLSNGGTLTLVSRSAASATTTGNSTSLEPVISGDGSTIAFTSNASDLPPETVNNNRQDVFAFAVGTGVMTLVSHIPGNTGQGGNSHSSDPRIDNSGDNIAFESSASTLTADADGNSLSADVYVSNSGTVSLISKSTTAGQTANNSSALEDISGDGTTVLFRSGATDLVTGFSDGNSNADLFVSDAGTVSLVNHIGDDATSSNQRADFGTKPISDDGNTIVFTSRATDLVAGFVDNNGVDDDVFRYDGGTVSLVSHRDGAPTTTGNDESVSPVISADGTSIAFATTAADLNLGVALYTGRRHLFIEEAGVNELGSLRQGGPTGSATPGDFSQLGNSPGNRISDDGRFVVFASRAPNVVPGQRDGNNAYDVFLFDRLTSTVSLVSHTGDGVSTGSGDSTNPSISADGTTIVFESMATDLVAGSDTNAAADVFAFSSGTVSLISHIGDGTTTGDAASSTALVSDDGSVIGFQSQATGLVGGFTDHNAGGTDVFSSIGGTVSLVSRGGGATSGANGSSTLNALSGDGSTFVFSSLATDLVPGTDTNLATDVFSFSAGTMTLVSRSSAGATIAGNGISSNARVSDDGSRIVFESAATDLVSGFVNNNGTSRDTFLFDGTLTTLISGAVGSATQSGNGVSSEPVISGDGSTVAFTSQSTNLVVASDNNGSSDIFASTGGAISLVSHVATDAGTTANSGSYSPVISHFGETIAFTSSATNLIAGSDTNSSGTDVFASSGGVVALVSRSASGAVFTGNGSSFGPQVNASGDRVAFNSSSSDLVPNDLNSQQDVFAITLPLAVQMTVSPLRVEGVPIVINAAASDPGGDNATVEYEYAVFKNGSMIPFATSTGTNLSSFAFTPDDDGSYEIEITVTDEDMNTATTSQTINVANVAPLVTIDDASVTVDESDMATNTGTFSDPDPVTLSASVGTVTDLGGGNFSWEFDTTDGPDESQTVTITATDDDGAASTRTFALVVNNVAPSVSVDNADVTVNEGETATNSGTFAEVGDDTVTLSASVGTVIDTGGGTWAWSFNTTDAIADTQTVTITATDSDTDFNTVTFDLLVGMVVSTLVDESDGDFSAGDLSLREAVERAGTTSAADLISFDDSLIGGTITLGGSRLAIGADLTINGPGSAFLTIDADNLSQIFVVQGIGTDAAISGLTLTGGNAAVGSFNLRRGGAIYNGSAELTLTDVVMFGNSAAVRGGALYNAGQGVVTLNQSQVFSNQAGLDGGGLFNSGNTLQVFQSTVAGNTSGRFGGGLQNGTGRMLTISDSTISGNHTDRAGGGLINRGTATLINSTFSGNTSNQRGGGIANFGSTTIDFATITGNRSNVDDVGSGGGGGLWIAGTAPSTLLFSTIVAGNFRGSGTTAPADIFRDVDAGSAQNLIGDAGTSGGLMDGTNGNIVGNNGSGTLDINTILDTTLANNGGPTQTHALVAGSLAIDAGDDTLFSSLANDQRGGGFPRIVGPAADIGAFERP